MTDFNTQQILAYTDTTLCFNRSGSAPENLQQLVAFLDDLPPTAVRTAIESLRPEDLEELTSDVNATSWMPFCRGLDAEQKGKFFTVLATKLDGAQIDKVATAFGNQADTLALAQAVAESGPTRTKVEFVRALLKRQDDTERKTLFRSDQTLPVGANDGRNKAVAILLGGLRDTPAIADDLLKEFSPTESLEVLSAALAASPDAKGYDTRMLGQLVLGLDDKARGGAECAVMLNRSQVLHQVRGVTPKDTSPVERDTVLELVRQYSSESGAGGNPTICLDAQGRAVRASELLSP